MWSTLRNLVRHRKPSVFEIGMAYSRRGHTRSVSHSEDTVTFLDDNRDENNSDTLQAQTW